MCVRSRELLADAECRRLDASTARSATNEPIVANAPIALEWLQARSASSSTSWLRIQPQQPTITHSLARPTSDAPLSFAYEWPAAAS